MWLREYFACQDVDPCFLLAWESGTSGWWVKFNPKRSSHVHYHFNACLMEEWEVHSGVHRWSRSSFYIHHSFKSERNVSILDNSLFVIVVVVISKTDSWWLSITLRILNCFIQFNSCFRLIELKNILLYSIEYNWWHHNENCFWPSKLGVYFLILLSLQLKAYEY